jgi:hypothetical protein
MRIIKSALAMVFILSFAVTVLAEDVEIIYHSNVYNDVPEPRLQYPVTDKVILIGKEPLEFKWWNDHMGIDHFMFKIYKGYNMYESGLIHKQILSSNEASVKIKSELFDDSQVYTWSLIQVSHSGQKSDKNFNSFKVIKKQEGR